MSEFKSPLLEVLFTPEWAAIYDPVTRERWAAEALLNNDVFDALCVTGKPAASGMGPDLAAAGIVTEQAYDREHVESWIRMGWADAARHYLHTNFLPKLDYSTPEGWQEDFQTMHTKVEDCPPPPLTKEYPGNIPVPLGDGDPLEFSLGELMEGGRRHSAEELTLARLSTLLKLVFGVSSHKTLRVTGTHLRKRSPSGGSRHPTEAYVLAFDVPGLAPGVYHYNPASHGLVSLKDGNFQEHYMTKVFGLNRRLAFVPRAAIVLTSVVERSMHRYRDSRSYRVLHFDIGHLLQSLQLVTRAQGIQCFTAYSLADSEAEELLGIDGLMETAMTQIVL